MTRVITITFIFGLIVIAVVSCSRGVTNPTSTPVLQKIQTPARSSTATLTAVLPEITATPPALTVSPTLAFTSTPSRPAPTPTQETSLTSTPQWIISNCLEISDRLPPGAEVTGTIFLDGDWRRYGFDNEASYLLEIKSGKKVLITPKEDNHIVSYAVSPNQKWLAYERIGTEKGNQDNIIVMDAAGQINATIPMEENWSFYNWLNDANLLIQRPNPAWTPDDKKYEAGRIILSLLDPFTNQRQDLSSDFPDISSSDYLFGWSAYTIYNPTLTRVLYPVWRDGKAQAIVWDMQSAQEIAQIPSNPIYLTPKWSLDGKWLAYGGPADPKIEAKVQADDFFLVSEDGKISRLTHLTDSARYIIHDYNWSPDGQHIAFWMKTQDDLNYHLAVVDIESGQVTDYCLQSYQYQYGTFIPPIWSPDGKQIIVDSRDPQNENRRLVVLVDIVQGYAAVIAEHVLPGGWLANP